MVEPLLKSEHMLSPRQPLAYSDNDLTESLLIWWEFLLLLLQAVLRMIGALKTTFFIGLELTRATIKLIFDYENPMILLKHDEWWRFCGGMAFE